MIGNQKYKLTSTKQSNRNRQIQRQTNEFEKIIGRTDLIAIKFLFTHTRGIEKIIGRTDLIAIKVVFRHTHTHTHAHAHTP